jgi:hypothetical protein
MFMFSTGTYPALKHAKCRVISRASISISQFLTSEAHRNHRQCHDDPGPRLRGDAARFQIADQLFQALFSELVCANRWVLKLSSTVTACSYRWNATAELHAN